MTPEERKRMDELCELIKEEKNHDKFIELIQEFNELLRSKEHRMEKPQTPQSSPSSN